MKVRETIPWYGRMAAKIVLSRLPLPRGAWRRLSCFQHGAMDRPEYAFNVFAGHLRAAGLEGERPGLLRTPSSARTMLELGPGDAISSALLGAAAGFASTLLVDTGRFATTGIAPYLAMVRYLRDARLAPPDLQPTDSVDAMLRLCHGRYLTQGIDSLRDLPDRSVDFIWSTAVMEHIRRADFLPLLRELRRIVSDGGVCSHSVDFRDHLGGALNNLRFSDRSWESGFLARSGFYTNRLRFSEMTERFREAGFRVEARGVRRWDALPTPRRRLHERFQALSEDDLRVSSADFLLHPMVS